MLNRGLINWNGFGEIPDKWLTGVFSQVTRKRAWFVPRLLHLANDFERTILEWEVQPDDDPIL